jgi:HlyD family secretion protein
VAFGYRAYRVTPAAEVSDKDTDARAASSLSGGTAASSGEVVLEAKGYVTPVHDIQLSPQVGGEIVELDKDFKEGAVYKQGAKLAQIDPVLYEAQVRSAEAALQVAKTNLQQVETGSTVADLEVAKSQLKNMAAKLEFSRIDERYNLAARTSVAQLDTEKSTAQVKVDQTAYDVQKNTVTKLEVSLQEQRAVAKAQVLSAQANLDQARKQLQNCTITAPTTGVILTKKAELHGYVNPLAFGASGYLCEMADLSDIEIEVMVQERDVANIFKDQKASIMPDAYQRDETFLKKHPSGYDGVVSRLMPTADRSKGAIPVRVQVLNIPADEVGFYLKPDMGANVSFKKKPDK